MFYQICKKWNSLPHRTVLKEMYHQFCFQKLKVYLFCLKILQRKSNLFLIELIFSYLTVIICWIIDSQFLKSIARIIIFVNTIFVYARAVTFNLPSQVTQFGVSEVLKLHIFCLFKLLLGEIQSLVGTFKCSEDHQRPLFCV